VKFIYQVFYGDVSDDTEMTIGYYGTRLKAEKAILQRRPQIQKHLRIKKIPFGRENKGAVELPVRGRVKDFRQSSR
jgi:hypothetical protein